MKKFLAALVVLALAGCTDPVDQAAKKNIFSPENPPKVIAARNEKLPPENLADNPELARRVLQMGVAEVTERIGAHQYQAQVSFEWTGSERQGRAHREAPAHRRRRAGWPETSTA